MHVGTRADIKRECRKQTRVSWGMKIFYIALTLKKIHLFFLIGFFDLASLKKLKDGIIKQHDIKLKCYLKCFMVKSGILNENSSIDVEKALRHLPPNMQASSRKILHRCKSIRKSSPLHLATWSCNKVNLYNYCNLSNIHLYFIFSYLFI